MLRCVLTRLSEANLARFGETVLGSFGGAVLGNSFIRVSSKLFAEHKYFKNKLDENTSLWHKVTYTLATTSSELALSYLTATVFSHFMASRAPVMASAFRWGLLTSPAAMGLLRAVVLLGTRGAD